MDVNVLVVCITVTVCLLVVCATTLACVEKVAENGKPRSLAEMIGGAPRGDGGGDRHE